MGHALPFSRDVRLLFSVTLLLVLGFCYCSDKSVEVSGSVECTDCSLNNAESSNVLSGQRVAISCKVSDGKIQTRGVGEIKEGKFKVALPSEIVNDEGHLKEECFAKLQTPSNTPCSTSNELEASKVIYKSSDNGKHILGLKGKLEFSPTVCASAFKYFYKHHPLLKKAFKKPYIPPSVPTYVDPHHPPLRTEPFPPLSSFPPLFGGYPPHPNTKVPLKDGNYLLHHKHLPPLHKYKPIPKVPFVHKKPPLPPLHKYKPIPKIPHHPFHKHPRVPVIPPDHHA